MDGGIMDNISKFENKTKTDFSYCFPFEVPPLLSLLKVASYMQSNAEKMGEVGHKILSIIHHTKIQYLI